MSRYIVPNLLFFILYIIPLSYPSLQAQTRDTIYVFDQQFYSGDTIQLSEINLFAKERTFTDLEAQERYLLLRNRLYAMKHTMDTMHNNKQKRIYVKRTQKYLEEHFTDELKKLSRSQGRILIKLIHRQTGQIAYDLVKNMRNGWTAFWYNNTAWLYDLSLKKGYDPVNIEEDYWIEEIILRAINTGEIEYQTPALRFNFSELSEQRQKRLAN